MASALSSQETLIVSDPVVDVPRPATAGLTENLVFFGHDASTGLSYWSHMGRLTPDPAIWEAIFTVVFPDGEVLSHRSIGRSALEPASAELRYELLEPLQRWRLSLDGVAQRVLNKDAQSRPVTFMHGPDGSRIGDSYEHLVVDIEFAGTSPVWDTGGHDWGRMHVHQLGRAKGHIKYRGTVVEVDFAGGRDHTRGSRDYSTFAGDSWVVCTFPSGRAVDMLLAWTTDGEDWARGMVWDGSSMQTVRDATRAPLHDYTGAPHAFEVDFSTDAGPEHLSCEVLTSFPYTLVMPTGIVPGVDEIDGATLVVVEAGAKYTWRGETAYGWIERCLPVDELRSPGPAPAG